ncbi:MAG TPA: hypothetical protein ACFYD3_09495 [Candidatus Hypogeohydataceae bacterium YC41]
MSGFNLAAIVFAVIFFIFFSLIFITRLGQSKGYNFFVGELAMFTAVFCATIADTSVKFFDLPYILPFCGGMVFFVFASILFGRAAFSEHSQIEKKAGTSSRPQQKT